MRGIAKYSLVAIDTDRPEELARFYSQLTGWPVKADSSDDWIELEPDGGPTIAFQLVVDYSAPDWPGSEHPQQLHLDFDVDDLDEGEKAVLALGATKAELQPGTTWRVYLDPSGHPFCLVRA